MKVIYQKVTLFFIALAVACATAQPLSAKPYVKRTKQAAAAQPASNETYRTILRIGLYTGAVNVGLLCLDDFRTIPQSPGISCCNLACKILLLKLYLTLAADSTTDREGALSRWIKQDGALAHILVGGMQLGFGALMTIVGSVGCVAIPQVVERELEREGALAASSAVFAFIGCAALGIANCVSGAKKIRKAFSIGAE